MKTILSYYGPVNQAPRGYEHLQFERNTFGGRDTNVGILKVQVDGEVFTAMHVEPYAGLNRGDSGMHKYVIRALQDQILAEIGKRLFA